MKLEGKEEAEVIGEGGLELAENEEPWICRFVNRIRTCIQATVS